MSNTGAEFICIWGLLWFKCWIKMDPPGVPFPPGPCLGWGSAPSVRVNAPRYHSALEGTGLPAAARTAEE